MNTNANTAFEAEIDSPRVENPSKASLMYMYDYYYAADQNYWSYPGFNSNQNDYRVATTSNWMYIGVYDEWSMSVSVSDDMAYYVQSSGHTSYTDTDSSFIVRPVFYLNLDVKRTGGIGKIDRPYRISQ